MSCTLCVRWKNICFKYTALASRAGHLSSRRVELSVSAGFWVRASQSLKVTSISPALKPKDHPLEQRGKQPPDGAVGCGVHTVTWCLLVVCINKEGGFHPEIMFDVMHLGKYVGCSSWRSSEGRQCSPISVTLPLNHIMGCWKHAKCE